MNKIIVLSVNLSTNRSRKFPQNEIIIEENGVKGDVHAQKGNRQVSLIDEYHVNNFKKITSARNTEFGEFAENISIKGLGNKVVRIFDIFKIGDVILEVTQIGKEFHREFSEIGHYVMPRVGIFCRVLQTGKIKSGDNIEYFPKVFKTTLITLSDRASQGEYKDKSGPEIKKYLEKFFEKKDWNFEIDYKLIPDDPDELTSLALKSKKEKCDLIITTGGTGIGERDFTIDVIKPMLDKEIPGIMELIRVKYGMEKPAALLSRSVAGVIDKSLVFTLPGSVKAVKEYMTEINKSLEHLVYMLHGIDKH
ncbi:MAG: molybdenum cofactor synthesis domain-containing protein [Bacteroidota bacterium]|nr:molybdenum cofactor synthesis domain-containing protein [Bacteroidota bacterium]